MTAVSATVAASTPPATVTATVGSVAPLDTAPERWEVALLGGLLQPSVDALDVRPVGTGEKAVVQGGVLDLGGDSRTARLADRLVAGDPAGRGLVGYVDAVSVEQPLQRADVTRLGVDDAREGEDVTEVREDLGVGGVCEMLVGERREEVGGLPVAEAPRRGLGIGAGAVSERHAVDRAVDHRHGPPVQVGQVEPFLVVEVGEQLLGLISGYPVGGKCAGLIEDLGRTRQCVDGGFVIACPDGDEERPGEDRFDGSRLGAGPGSVVCSEPGVKGQLSGRCAGDDDRICLVHGSASGGDQVFWWSEPTDRDGEAKGCDVLSGAGGDIEQLGPSASSRHGRDGEQEEEPAGEPDAEHGLLPGGG